MNDIVVEGRKIGECSPCFLIAEIGSNHNLDKSVVKQLIDHAAQAGFDAVKFQLYDAEEVFSKNEMTSDVGLDHLYGQRPWWEVARDIILMPRAWFGEMFDYVRQQGMIPLSAIHREADAQFLLEFDLPAFKIASIDLHYHQLLEQLSCYHKPMIISTGMAYLSEIDETMRLLKQQNCTHVALLHCISQYPPRPEELNLRNIDMLKKSFGVPVGFSDHSTGILSSVVAVSLGASIIEKHVTLDKTMKGPDHAFALEPHEMYALVKAIRETEAALGTSVRKLSSQEISARAMIRRSVVAKQSFKKGEKVTYDKVKFARPGKGIPTCEFKYLEGRTVNRDVEAETLLSWDILQS